jgi:hypothetical protein
MKDIKVSIHKTKLDHRHIYMYNMFVIMEVLCGTQERKERKGK